jgi:hypothetical protein
MFDKQMASPKRVWKWLRQCGSESSFASAGVRAEASLQIYNLCTPFRGGGAERSEAQQGKMVEGG